MSEPFESSRYRVVAYDDDGLCVEQENDCETLDEAISFAKPHRYDAVIGRHTGKTVWYR